MLTLHICELTTIKPSRLHPAECNEHSFLLLSFHAAPKLIFLTLGCHISSPLVSSFIKWERSIACSDEAQSTPPPKKMEKKICKLDLGLLCNLRQNLQLEPKVRKAYLLAVTINASRLMTQPQCLRKQQP